jgi:uncharacterized membrane protein YeaQ/YmgE (transglycosylase-associated protein family)
MAVIGWIIFGLIVGLIARFVMPGTQSMGFIMTTLLGVAGAFVGGFIATRVNTGSFGLAEPAGWIGAVLGALLLLFLYGLVAKKKV